MNIALLPVDSRYPNLALMKVSAYHKHMGDHVEMYSTMSTYDVCYMSKIFSFTADYGYYMTNVDKIVKGGTGYSLTDMLPPAIDKMQPDYSIYPSIDNKTAYGFLTRGCPNKCKWCVVPRKEGAIHAYNDIDNIAVDGRNNIILMDNNVLASDYGLNQIEKIIKRKLHIDFNQALDARLVTPEIAKLLAQVKWIKRIRFGCDTPGQIEDCEKAINLIDSYGYKGEYFFYCILIGDFMECYHRINHWRKRGGRFLPFCQPYRDPDKRSTIIPQWQKDMASWVDKKWVFRSCEFKEFKPRKDFICSQYFD